MCSKEEEESERIVRLAGKLIAAGIRDLYAGTDVYPSAENVSDSLSDKGTGKWAPHLLVVFLKELVSSRVKVNALSQCIVQAARPQTAVLPVPLSVTVSIDNVCGSSELIIESARLGLCVSYDELLRFKQSVIVTRDNVIRTVSLLLVLHICPVMMSVNRCRHHSLHSSLQIM